MLLFEECIVALELLEPGDLARRALRQCLPRAPCQSAVAHILAPLGQHERMDRERRGHRAHLNPRLLTEAHRGQLELVTVLADAAWSRSRHARHSALLGGGVYESGARPLDSCSG